MGLITPGYLTGLYHPDGYFMADYHPEYGRPKFLRGVPSYIDPLQTSQSYIDPLQTSQSYTDPLQTAISYE